MQEQLQVYVINLPSQTDRKAAIQKRLRAVPNLSIEIIAAVNGKALFEAQLADEVHPSCGLTPGEIGCVLSHRKCYERVLADGNDIALILEDDTLLSERFDDVIAELACFFKTLSSPSVLLLSARTYSSATPSYSVDGINIHKTWSGVGTYSYLINRTGAERMLRRGMSLPIRCVADKWERAVVGGVSLFACVPHLASFLLDRSDSSLHRDRISAYILKCEKMEREPRWFRWIKRKASQDALYRLFFKIFYRATFFERTWPKGQV